MPRPCLESECRHCLRNGQTDEGTIETVRVHGESTEAESKLLREKHYTVAPVLKWVELERRRPSWAEGSAMSEDVKIY